MRYIATGSILLRGNKAVYRGLIRGFGFESREAHSEVQFKGL